jgi:hypothetical protein
MASTPVEPKVPLNNFDIEHPPKNRFIPEAIPAWDSTPDAAEINEKTRLLRH